MAEAADAADGLPERVLPAGSLIVADLHLDLAGSAPPTAFLRVST